MRSVRFRIVVGIAVLVVTAFGSGLYFFRHSRSWPKRMVSVAAPTSKTTAWADSRSGAGEWFVVNLVYPPVVVGRYDRSGRKLVPMGGSSTGPRAAETDPVFQVNPTFPAHVTGTFEPLRQGKQFHPNNPKSAPRSDVHGPGIMIRADGDRGAHPPPPESR